MPRRYEKFRDTPFGVREKPNQCVVSVKQGSWSKQCSNGRGYGDGEHKGLLCYTHAQMQASGKTLHVPLDEPLIISVTIPKAFSGYGALAYWHKGSDEVLFDITPKLKEVESALAEATLMVSRLTKVRDFLAKTEHIEPAPIP